MDWRRRIRVGKAQGKDTPEEMLARAIRRAEAGDLIMVPPTTYDMTFVDYPDPLPHGLSFVTSSDEATPVFVHALEFMRVADAAKAKFGGVLVKPFAKGSNACPYCAKN